MAKRENTLRMKRFLAGATGAAAMLHAAAAMAAQPEPWQARFQPPATDIMAQIEWFEVYTLWFIVPITLLVLALLGWCIVRFRASRNPTPSRTSHNTVIEVIWTVGPVLILLLLAVPSFQLLTAQYTPPEDPALTIKASGEQWYWNYEYVDQGLAFDSNMLKEEERLAQKPGQPRLLAVNYELVVPVETTVRLQITASPTGVIHAFAVPSFGVKVDAVPGRLNETWFYARKTGLYYGQCSELCGQDHAFMPIAVRVVEKDQFDLWLKTFEAGLIDDANDTLPKIE